VHKVFRKRHFVSDLNYTAALTSSLPDKKHGVSQNEEGGEAVCEAQEGDTQKREAILQGW